MTGLDGLGFVAAGLVLATFCVKQLVPLRALAIMSNLAFILYGYCARLDPVLVLHLTLLPVNAFRLRQALAADLPGTLDSGVVTDR
jgi:CRP/FNR family transcriptional regulator, cyclic AMP receptor protein